MNDFVTAVVDFKFDLASSMAAEGPVAQRYIQYLDSMKRADLANGNGWMCGVPGRD